MKKLLTVDEIFTLRENTCPFCSQSLDYENGNLLCLTCHKTWNYSYVKACRIAYEESPYTYPNFSLKEK